MLRNSFLHHLFGGKIQSDKSGRHESGRRTLNLESLEDRHMLSVGFDAPIVKEYVPSSTGAVNPNLVGHQLLFSGDIDNNGTMDILAIDSGKVYTYLNSGNKQNAFPNPGVLASGSFLRMMRADVGKVTGGANLDLLGASITDNIFNFSVYGGRGDGGFYNIPTESSWSGLADLLKNRGVTIPTNGTLNSTLGDAFLVANNGRLDLLCTVFYYVPRADSSLYDSGTINLLFANDGSGKFTTTPSVIAAGNTGIIAAGDLTGDGKPDYVTRNDQDPTKLDIYLNNGTKITTGVLGQQIGEVVVAKCHTGTKMEIIAAVQDANGNNFIRVITVSGTTATLSSQYAVDIVPMNIVAGDFDNDNLIDIFISDGNIHQTLLGQSNNTFKAEKSVVVNADFMAVYSADFNGDGNIDVLAVGKRFAWLIPGDTSKSPSVAVDFGNYNLTPKNVVFGDFNGNGKVDFAVLNHTGKEVHVFTQSSTPSTSLFTKAATTLSASDGKQLLVANFDNANGDDIVIYGVDGAGRPIMQTYLSNATGGFDAVKTTTLTFANNDVYDLLAVGDVNGNGYIDVVGIYNGSTGTTTTRNSYFQVITYDANDGLFKSGQKGEVPAIKNPTAVATADMNANGKNDLVILDADSKSVWILPQATATGTFWNNANMKSYLVTGLTVDNAAFSQMAIADFNGDGVNDVLVGVWTTSGNLTFRVLENDPVNKGTLKTAETNVTYMENNFVGANASGLALYVGRVDDNGTPDVVFVGGNSVKTFLNADKSGAEIGTVTLVIRDYSSTIVNTEIVDLNTLTDRLSFIDEWSNFWVEIWANTGISAGISSFATTLNFNADVFEVRSGKIEYGSGVTASSTPVINNGTGTITLSGTVTGSKGANTNALLARVSFMPADVLTTSLPLNVFSSTTYVQPVNNGFSLDGNATTLTMTGGTTGRPDPVASTIPLFPMIYDADGSGAIDMGDFAIFVNCFGKTVTATATPAYLRLFDYDHNGSVNLEDFMCFEQNFRRQISRAACRANPTLKTFYPTNFPDAFLVNWQPAGAAAAHAELLADMVDDVAAPLMASMIPSVQQQTATDQSTQNQALMSYIASQETKSDDYGIPGLNQVSETARLIAEGKL